MGSLRGARHPWAAFFGGIAAAFVLRGFRQAPLQLVQVEAHDGSIPGPQGGCVGFVSASSQPILFHMPYQRFDARPPIAEGHDYGGVQLAFDGSRALHAIGVDTEATKFLDPLAGIIALVGSHRFDGGLAK